MTFKTMLAFLSHFSFACFAAYPNVEMMTLEEKIGQLLMVHFNGETANEEAEVLIQKVHVGGFIYYNWANGLNSPEQVLCLSSSLQKLNDQNRIPIPLFIAVDQEGGLIARLTKGFTIFPGNKALGMANNDELAEQSAFAMGQELNAVGVNFNLSPVVDVNCNPCNPVIGIRSFGSSTDIVIPFAQKVIHGYHRAGMITSLKHFPGHGDVEVDSHQDLPLIKKSKRQLQNVELLPFKELSPLADTVMTAHVLVPSIDPINCATLSKDVLGILRDEMGFDGVIISDSLVMEGLLKNCTSIDEAAIRALNAGCDILMLGGKQLIGAHANLELTVADVERIHQSLVNAVKGGTISEKRVDQAVRRILTLKDKHKLLPTDDKKNLAQVNNREHILLAKKIASLALNVTQNNKISVSLAESKIAVFGPQIVEDGIRQTSFLKLGKETHSQFFKGLNPNDEEIKAANAVAEKADLVIFFSYNAWKNSSQAALIQSLSKSKKPLTIIPLRDPLDASLFPQAALILTTFGPTVPSIQAACERLYEISLKDNNSN